jgi:anti-sigma regulatory factor (Ser/Thr protein kinase)
MDYDTGVKIKLSRIREALTADIILGDDTIDTSVSGIYASDLMSDVLAYGKPDSVLLTGLCTPQASISAYMADFRAVIFLRGKRPTDAHLKIAREKGLVLMTTEADMFEACVKIAPLIYQDFQPVDTDFSRTIDGNVTVHEFNIDGKDFANAGMVSTGIKSILKTIGYEPALIRRIAISTYEAEMNVVMHALRARVMLTASNEEISVLVDDEGKGIPDVELAMQEGFSTATEEQRAMGFGAGMGLPNIRRNSDLMNLSSVVAKGTRLEMKFFIKQ